jgi:hypothetical protein
VGLFFDQKAKVNQSFFRKRGLRFSMKKILLLSALVASSAWAQNNPFLEMIERLHGVQNVNAIDQQTELVCDEPQVPFPRVHSDIPISCGSQRTIDEITHMLIFDCKNGKDELYPSGFRFGDGPGHPLFRNIRSPYSDGDTPRREIQIVSRNHALNETYLYLADLAGGPDSHDVKSVMFLLPRKSVPQARKVGNEVHVTLPTGEEVVFDKTSNAIIRGALNEGPMHLTTDRFARRPPNVNYQGSGISIRLNHRYEEPTMSSTTAEIKQGNQTCTVQRTHLFTDQGKLRTENDEDFVKVLNQRCPGKNFKI